MRRRRLLFLAQIAPIALAAACGSGGTTTTVVGSIALSLTPTSTTIQQGGSTQVTGTLTRTNFTGDVAISVDGAPNGVSGSVTLAPVNGGSTAQVTLAAASSTVVGTYPLTIVARGTGVDSATATFTLTIAAATPASYTMALTTPSQTLAQGGTAPSAITFVRTAFTGHITLTAENLPAGVTATFDTNPVLGSSSNVTFTASPTAQPGTFNTILIRGTAAGLTDVTAAVTLIVTVSGSFAIAAGSNTLNVVQGNTVATGVNATRTGGFAGTIAYTVTGPSNAALPAGLSATVTPTGTADQNTLTVTTTTGLAPATYPIVIHGTSFGLDQTANVNVVVAAAGSAVRLDFSGCVATAKPIWVAFQDGSGAWTTLTGVGDVYQFNLVSANGAYAVVTNGGFFQTTVRYFARTEAAAQAAGCAVPASGGKIVNGTVSGLTAADQANISLGSSNTSVRLPNTTFQLQAVPPGIWDLVTYRRNDNTPGAVNDKILIRRDQNILANGSLGLIDFSSSEAVLPAIAQFTITGFSSGDQTSQTMNYLTGTACSASAVLYNKTGPASTVYAYGWPSTAPQRATDFHYFFLAVYDQNGVSSRNVTLTAHTLTNMTLALGNSISPTVSILAGPYKRLQAVVTFGAGYDLATLNYNDAGFAHAIMVRQSAGYIAGTSTTLAMPDLSGAPGFLVSWEPATNATTPWNVAAQTANFGPPVCVEGGISRLAAAGGTN